MRTDMAKDTADQEAAQQKQHDDRMAKMDSVAQTMSSGVTSAASTSATALKEAASIKARAAVAAAAIAASAGAGASASPQRQAGAVANARSLLAMFPNDASVAADQRVGDRIRRFLGIGGVFEEVVFKAITDNDIDLDSLLDWASGEDKPYFTTKLQQSGVSHPTHIKRVYDVCVRAIADPSAFN